jgi:hypothetical protein
VPAESEPLQPLKITNARAVDFQNRIDAS